MSPSVQYSFSHRFLELSFPEKNRRELRTWRGNRYRFLTVKEGKEEMIYWHMGFIINRTLECSLENDGYPSKATLKKIRRHFMEKRKIIRCIG